MFYSQVVESIRRDNFQLQNQLEFSKTLNNKLQTEIEQLSEKLQGQQDTQAMVSNYTQERSYIKSELRNILSMYSDVDGFRTPGKFTEFKLSRTHDMIQDIVKNLLSQMTENEEFQNRSTSKGFSGSKTQQFGPSYLSNIGGFSTYDSGVMNTHMRDFSTRSQKFNIGEDRPIDDLRETTKRSDFSAAKNRYNLGVNTDMEYATDKETKRKCIN